MVAQAAGGASVTWTLSVGLRPLQEGGAFGRAPVSLPPTSSGKWLLFDLFLIPASTATGFGRLDSEVKIRSLKVIANALNLYAINLPCARHSAKCLFTHINLCNLTAVQ